MHRAGSSPAAIGLIAPAFVGFVDIDGADDEGVIDARYRSALLLARSGGVPVGAVAVALPTDMSVPQAELRRRVIEGLRPQASGDGRASARPSASAPSVSVVVAAIAATAALERCIASILNGLLAPEEVIVVDNRPGASDVRRLVGERFGDDQRVRVVDEPRQGLSWARNAGLAAAGGEIVAFTDDDIVADPGWLQSAATVLADDPDVACVTGLILPLRLEAETQVLLEQFAGFSKGFERRTFTLDGGRRADPLFPYAAGQVGSGANTIVRRAAVERLGGFDVALGAGTPASGGEDLDLFIRLLLGGQTIVYEPAAMIWHDHPVGARRLRRQVFFYGVGLTAMLTKQLGTGERLRLLRLALRGLRYALDPQSRKNAAKPADYPARLDLLERLGMALGPLAYVRSRSVASRLQRAASQPSAHDFAPTATGPLDLDSALQPFAARASAGRPYGSALLLVRLHGQPLGVIRVPLSAGRITADELAEHVAGALADDIRRHADRHGCLRVEGSLTDALGVGLGAASGCPAAARPDTWPRVTVIVPTAGRPEDLRACLTGLRALSYPDFEILVADNRPGDGRTRAVVDEIVAEDPRVRYVAEAMPGSSVARNRGVAVTDTPIVAFTDDDVTVDPLWLSWLVEPFLSDPAVDATTGLVMPASMETPAQAWFEAYSGFGKGFERRAFDLDEHRPSGHLLYPYWGGVFGSGNSMAFRRERLAAMGGFDPSLGAGSPALAGSDVEAMSRVVLNGGRLIYEPRSVCWHDHRRDEGGLQRQLYNYGVGFTAILTKWVLRRPALVLSIAGGVAATLRSAMTRGDDATPRELSRLGTQFAMNAEQATLGLQVRGYLAGPWKYVRSRRWADRLALDEILPPDRDLA